MMKNRILKSKTFLKALMSVSIWVLALIILLLQKWIYLSMVGFPWAYRKSKKQNRHIPNIKTREFKYWSA